MKLTKQGIIAVVLAIAISSPSYSQMLQSIVVAKRPAGAIYSGLGDITSLSFWWGFRAYNATKAAAQVNSVDLRRSSDSATCTAKVATNGDLDLAVGTVCNGASQTVTGWATRGTFSGAAISGTSLTFSSLSGSASSGDEIVGTGVANRTTIVGACTVSPCTVTPSQTVSSTTIADLIPILVPKIYDQTGNNACAGTSCDLIQATSTAQARLIFNCTNLRPCLYSPGGGDAKIYRTANNFTPSGTATSMTAVSNRITGTQSSCIWVSPGDGSTSRDRIGCQNATNWSAAGSGSIISVAVATNVWHAVNALINTNPATSVFNVDGSESTSTTPTLNTTADRPTIQLSGAFATLTSGWTEGGAEGSAAWSGPTRTSICNNQRLYWSTGGSC